MSIEVLIILAYLTGALAGYLAGKGYFHIEEEKEN
jgi:hypothetical protein